MHNINVKSYKTEQQGSDVALNCTTACCRMWLIIRVYLSVCGQTKIMSAVVISSLHGPWSTYPSHPTSSSPSLCVVMLYNIQCSHAGLRCINHWTTDTELCNRLPLFTIVAVAAVQTDSRESLVTMPTIPATRLLSTQMGLLPFMHSWPYWLCWLQ